MLNMFPALITYNLLAPVIIRLVLGVVFGYIGHHRIKTKEKGLVLFGMIHVIIGILFFVGLMTQVAAIVASIILVVQLAHKVKSKAFLTDGVNYYILLLAMSLSLIFSGSGLWALDWPL